MFPKAKLAENFKKLKLRKQDIFNPDFVRKFTKFRDKTKDPFCVTNVLLHATHLSHLPMGYPNSADFPDVIDSSRRVRILEINVSIKSKYNDNLCVLPAIAAFQLGKFKAMEATTMVLFNKYMQLARMKFATFTSLDLTDLTNVEKFCSCSIRDFLAGLLDVESNEIQSKLLY